MRAREIERERAQLSKRADWLRCDSSRGDAVETSIFEKLRPQLNYDEWIALPELISERLSGTLRVIESERLRREIEENENRNKARIEAQKQESERQERALRTKQEKIHYENLRRDKEASLAQERIYQENLRREAEVRRSELFQEIRRRLYVDFLGVDSFFLDSCSPQIQQYEYDHEKISFVKLWLEENTPCHKNSDKPRFDNEQVEAIAAVNGHIQIVARAGSGKTTVLVYRALFLLKHCRVAPSELLLLAFNRKAALEIRRRLLVLLSEGAEAAIANDFDGRVHEAGKSNYKRIDTDDLVATAVETVAANHNITLPHVMTFHALAYAIVHPEENLIYDGADGESPALSRVVQKVIDDHRHHPSFKGQIRELMLAHFREDWDRVIEGGYNLNKEEFLQFRRFLPRESLGGDYVKSFGEKIIADFLFEHDISYKYERNHWWNEKRDGINVRTNYRPDFTIIKNAVKGKDAGVIIEYFGLKGDPDYDLMSDEKRDYWETKANWSLLEFSPRDIASNGKEAFLDILKSKLKGQGISCVRLSEDEIWHRIRDRAIDRFTQATVGFIGRCRQQSLSPLELRGLIDSYSPLSSAEKMFIECAHFFYAAYLDRLFATSEEDFNGLMKRASDMISAGQTLFQRKNEGGNLSLLRHVCIDEFQDFSELFYRLLHAIRGQNSGIELFCVGDD
ncbi:hypothetical protein BH11VER1_BH11VER1_30610 [soil metagenome]